MRIIAVTNEKGGVGKTTTTIHVAAGMQKLGKKVLVIDMDPQRNSTDTYRAQTEGVATLYDLLCENENANNCIQHTALGDIIACDSLLKGAEQKLPPDMSRFFMLKERCKDLEGKYDYIIIDTPPNAGVLTSNALTYANEVIIPLECDRYGLQGLSSLQNTIMLTKSYTNPNLSITGMLLNKYHKQRKLAKEVTDQLIGLATTLDTKVFNTKIRESEVCKQSQAKRISMFDMPRLCTTAIDYMELCKEIEG